MADALAGEEHTLRKGHIITEVKKQLWLAGPLIVSGILEKLIQVISLSFVGHLGELPLSAASMATSFAIVTGLSLLLGMGTALDTLCGQAYGAKQYHLLGIYLQRAMLLNIIASIPFAFIWAFTGRILHATGQDKEISMAAQLYARCMIPLLFVYGLLQCHYRFLQAQNIVIPMILTSGFTILVHIFACWFLIFKIKVGYIGAAIANSVSYSTSLALIAAYVWLSPRFKKTWIGFSREALHDLSSLIKLAVPSGLMICLEFWSFEAVVILSGLLPNPKLETSVLAICLTTVSLAYMIPFGISASGSTRVSNELGAGNSQKARSAVYIGEIISIIQGSIIGSILILGHNIWGKLYSKDINVVKHIAKMMPLLSLSIFMDATQCVLMGTVRGCGWQKLVVVVNLAAFYLVGLPSGILFAFVFHLREKGLWLGIICGLSTQVILLLIITLSTNWDKEAKKAENRINSSINSIGMITRRNEEVRVLDDGH
ncbi:protein DETOXIFICATION 16-like isoform X1 [Dioscorea cayenensis subsp. rotundata]|uniref:Protein DETOXIFICATION n=1 Tax=Dioscorea cayennensis subsp. rotundata TaxID=55577 RepID=A0AB40BTN8_DIOCR|nr:protein DETOXIFICATION 16-like isoform X1 [Dioscorea cayenensis subsp. rotundata]